MINYTTASEIYRDFSIKSRYIYYHETKVTRLRTSTLPHPHTLSSRNYFYNSIDFWSFSTICGNFFASFRRVPVKSAYFWNPKLSAWIWIVEKTIDSGQQSHLEPLGIFRIIRNHSCEIPREKFWICFVRLGCSICIENCFNSSLAQFIWSYETELS
jgi:hypothetical protein